MNMSLDRDECAQHRERQGEHCRENGQFRAIGRSGRIDKGAAKEEDQDGGDIPLGSAQDLITQQYLPKANILRFKTRDEAIVAAIAGKADGLVMTKKTADIGKVMVPTPVLSTPSVVAVNYASDEVFKSFVSGWAEYNRRIGNNQTWIVKRLEPFGITLEDMPVGFGFGG
nr:hypothetical protein [Mesorhizobium sp.]